MMVIVNFIMIIIAMFIRAVFYEVITILNIRLWSKWNNLKVNVKTSGF